MSWARIFSSCKIRSLTPLPEKALQLLETTSVNVLWFLITVVSVHFFLSQWPNMRDGLITFAPQPYRPEMKELYQRIRRVWMAYLRGQIVLMFIVGVVFTVAWTVIGIPGALVLGVIAGLFTLVPDVGPFLAAGLAIAVALLEGSTWIPLSNFWVAGICADLSGVDQHEEFLPAPDCHGTQRAHERGAGLYHHHDRDHPGGNPGCAADRAAVASAVVILGYLKRKMLGQPPFEDDGTNQFVMPEEEVNPSMRKWGRRATDRLEAATSSGIPGDAVAITEKETRPEWNRRATDRKESVSPTAPDSNEFCLPADACSRERTKMKITYSIVAPIYNERENLPELYRRVKEVMDSTGEPWELVLVDDGSTDGSTDIIRELAQEG